MQQNVVVEAKHLGFLYHSQGRISSRILCGTGSIESNSPEFPTIWIGLLAPAFPQQIKNHWAKLPGPCPLLGMTPPHGDLTQMLHWRVLGAKGGGRGRGGLALSPCSIWG